MGCFVALTVTIFGVLDEGTLGAEVQSHIAISLSPVSETLCAYLSSN